MNPINWNNLTVADKWLVVFIGCIIVNLIVILIDLLLDKNGWTTITQVVKEHSILEIPLVGWQFFAGLALHLHFVYYE